MFRSFIIFDFRFSLYFILLYQLLMTFKEQNKGIGTAETCMSCISEIPGSKSDVELIVLIEVVSVFLTS
jgi:hypothetical protein